MTDQTDIATPPSESSRRHAFVFPGQGSQYVGMGAELVRRSPAAADVLARADVATDGDYLNIDRVVAHEYFHNWTGDRVTCRDWFQLSLKEGLTVFRDQE